MVEITASDGANTVTQTVTVTVSDIAIETSPAISLQTFSIAENTASGTLVNTVAATDGDNAATTTFQSWSIVDANTADNPFAINSDTGAITVADVLDYETTTSYSLGITVHDGTNTSNTGIVVIDITDDNDNAPVITDMSASTLNVSSSDAPGTSIVTMTETDEDTNTSYSNWAIVSGDDNNNFSIDPTSGEITIANAANYGIYNLSITVSDGTNTSTPSNVRIQVNTNYPDGSLSNEHFISTWATTESNETITIKTQPSSYGYNYNIDCFGANASATFTATNQTRDYACTYPTAGEQTIRISGTFPAFQVGDDAAKLTAIPQWGNIQWQNMYRAFYNAINLTEMSREAPNLSQVLDMKETFSGAVNFNQDIGNWNTSNVTRFDYMFNGATNFNQDIGNWDTSAAIYMVSMFNGATNFDQDISGWDVSNEQSNGLNFDSNTSPDWTSAEKPIF